VSGWREIEVYGAFMKVTGELEIVGAERLSDSINRFGNFVHIRNARSEPMSVNYPVLSRLESQATLAKSGIVLICPLDDGADGNSAMWRERVAHPISLNTGAFSMVGDVHLEANHNLEDHLERHPGDFLPVTNLSALWITTISTETHALQRPFALLNPSSILSFSVR